MKRVRIIIKEKSINKRVGSEFLLFVYDEATILYAIDKIDWIIKRKAEKFPVEEFKSLLHMTYNPVLKRFYEQVIMHAKSPSKNFIPVRSNAYLILPDETTVDLILYNVCGIPEPGLKYEEFRQALTEDQILNKYIKINLNQ